MVGKKQNSDRPDANDRASQHQKTDWAPRYQCPGAQYHEYTCDEGVEYDDSCAGQPADESDWPADDDDSEVDATTSNHEPRSFCGDAGGTPALPPEHGVVPGPPPASTPPPATPPAVTGPAAAVGPTLTEEPIEAPIEAPSPDAAPPEETPPPAEPAPAVAPPPEPAPKSSSPPAEAPPSGTHGKSLGVRSERHSAPQQSAPVAVAASYATAAEPVVVKARPRRSAPVTTKRAEHKPAASKSQRRTTRPASTSKPSAPAREAQRPQPAGTPLANTSEPARDWFVVMLMAAFALALVALALAAVSEIDGAAALTRARSRLGSKGLSARRIAVADKVRTSRGIRYRD